MDPIKPNPYEVSLENDLILAIRAMDIAVYCIADRTGTDPKVIRDMLLNSAEQSLLEEDSAQRVSEGEE